MVEGVGLRLPTMDLGNAGCEQIILRPFKNPVSKSRLFSSRDNLAEGAEFGGLSVLEVKFDLRV